METLSVMTCISSICVFIMLVIPGYMAVKLKLLSSTQIDGFSILLVNFLWPAMVIDAMTSVTINERLLHLSIYTGVLTFIFYLISLLIALFYVIVRKLPKSFHSILIFAIAFNNTGLIGMPFIKEVLGKEALFIASIIELVNDIFIFSIGIMLFLPIAKSKKKIQLNGLLSPGFISVIIGFILFGLHISLPEIIAKPMGYLSNATTSIAMFLIGAQLGDISLNDLWKERKAYETSVFRLLLIPFLLFIFLFVIRNSNSLADVVLVVMFGMPTAACTAIFSRQYKNDYHFATKCVMLSTICSVVTLPLWLLLTNWF